MGKRGEAHGRETHTNLEGETGWEQSRHLERERKLEVGVIFTKRREEGEFVWVSFSFSL